MPKRLREYRMMFTRVPDGQAAVDPDAIGQRSKLGGAPDWVQEGEIPTCPDCQEPMTFVAQLDSIEHESASNPHSVPTLSRQQDFMFADAGMIYVFICLEHSQAAALVESE